MLVLGHIYFSAEHSLFSENVIFFLTFLYGIKLSTNLTTVVHVCILYNIQFYIQINSLNAKV